ncbi:MAG: lysophospholipid acyltransferase family protein [Candidatus Omnitrophota bacterium]
MLYYFYKFAAFLIGILPIRVTYFLAELIASGYFFFAKKDKINLAHNLSVVLEYTRNPRNINRASRMVFVNFAWYLAEFLRAAKFDLNYLRSHVEFQGKEHLDQALELRKGVILVSAHLGNWELGSMVVSMSGYPMNIVAWTHKDKKVNNFFIQQRQEKGVAVIPLGVAVRKVLTALAANQVVAFAGDIDFANPKEGIKVKLFGKDTLMPKGPATFSLKTGAPLVPTFMIREHPDRFRLILQAPILPESSGDSDADRIRLTEKIAQKMEAMIARYPEQWFMPTPRWQTPQNSKADR